MADLGYERCRNWLWPHHSISDASVEIVEADEGTATQLDAPPDPDDVALVERRLVMEISDGDDDDEVVLVSDGEDDEVESHEAPAQVSPPEALPATLLPPPPPAPQASSGDSGEFEI